MFRFRWVLITHPVSFAWLLLRAGRWLVSEGGDKEKHSNSHGLVSLPDWRSRDRYVLGGGGGYPTRGFSLVPLSVFWRGPK